MTLVAKASMRASRRSKGVGGGAKADYALRKRWNFCIVVHEECYLERKWLNYHSILEFFTPKIWYFNNFLFASQKRVTCLTRDFMLMVQSGRRSSSRKTNRHQSPMLMMTVTMAFRRIALHCSESSQSVTFARSPPLSLHFNPLCICPVRSRSVAVHLSIYSPRSLFGGWFQAKSQVRLVSLRSCQSNTSSNRFLHGLSGAVVLYHHFCTIEGIACGSTKYFTQWHLVSLSSKMT